MVIKCFEFFNCKKKDTCPYFTSGEERNCWEVEIALTPFIKFGAGIHKEEDKIIFCQNCLYYQHAQNNKD